MADPMSIIHIQTPLLRLPAELQQQIYSYILGNYHIKMTIPSTPPHNLTTPVLDPSALIWPMHSTDKDQPANKFSRTRHGRASHTFDRLFVCQQIYSEAYCLPLSFNDFSFAIIAVSTQWKTTLPVQTSAIMSVKLYAFEAKMWTSNEALRALGESRKVRRVEVIDRSKGTYER